MKHYTESELRAVLFSVKANSGTLKQMAADLEFRAPFLNDVLAGRRPIGKKLAAALGYEKLDGCYTRKKGA